MADLRGRLALVTAAGSGIGRATAMSLAGAGAEVVMSDIDRSAAESVAAEIAAAGGAARSFQLDVTDESAVSGAAAAVREAHGRIDVLANIAGGTLGADPKAIEADLDYWERVIAFNATSVLLMCRAFAPLMPSGGAIVKMASSAALTTNPRFAVYAQRRPR